MEAKIWLPDYLALQGNRIVWHGPDNVPIGTIFHPYQSPKLETLTFTADTQIPDVLKQENGVVSWMMIGATNSLAEATFVPSFGGLSSIELRQNVNKGDPVTIFSVHGAGFPFDKEETTGTTAKFFVSKETKKKPSKTKTMLPCSVCFKAFDRPSLLKRHLRTHTGEKPHICEICNKGFSTSSSLNTHRRIHSGEKPHACAQCGKRFTASSNLYYHKMTHNKEKAYKCKECPRAFSTPGELRSHQSSTHNSFLQCYSCFHQFPEQQSLKRHLVTHISTNSSFVTPKPFPDFRVATLLQKPFVLKCPHCGLAFSQMVLLRIHLFYGLCLTSLDASKSVCK